MMILAAFRRSLLRRDGEEYALDRTLDLYLGTHPLAVVTMQRPQPAAMVTT
jgi:hypothetical protein